MQPFHVDIGGRAKDNLPLAPWIRIRKNREQALKQLTYAKPGKGNRSGKPGRPGKPTKQGPNGNGQPPKRCSKGRRQPDFGRKPRYL